MPINPDQIIAQVRANQLKLEGCKVPHDFQRIGPEGRLGMKYQCTKCSGVVDHHAFYWYGRGLQHAKQ